MTDLTSSNESKRSKRRIGFSSWLGLMLAMAIVGVCSPRDAQAQGKVITISEVTIVGRVQKPIAAVDVSRIQPQMTLAELRQPFLDRIEKAIYRAPF
jgi:hypothetical protein